MSDTEHEVAPAVDHHGEIDLLEEQEAIEERRDNRKLKHTLVKMCAVTFLVVSGLSLLTLIYAAVFKDKDLNTTFIGELIKGIFDFMRFLLS